MRCFIVAYSIADCMEKGYELGMAGIGHSWGMNAQR